MSRIKNFSIRIKMILVILVSISFLASVLYIISSHVLTKSYSDIENQAILKDLNRSEDAIENLSQQLTVKLRDWASWDDTYEFILDSNLEYIDSNIGSNNLANLEINAMLFVDTEGRIVFKKVIDSETTEEIDSTEMGEYIESHKELVTHNNTESLIVGIVPFQSGTFMFTSLPILTSEGEGPVRGSLTFVDFLDENVIDKVAELTHLSVEVFPYGNPLSPDDVTTAENSLTAENNQFISPLSETSIAAYRVLSDYYGKPLLTLKVETSREIYKQGKFMFSFFVASLSVLFLVFGFILIALLQHFVVSRFTKLEKTVQKIGEKNDLTIRIKEDTKDEIGELAFSINNMLDKIVTAEKAEAESNEKVRVIGAELERRLAEAEKMNKMMVNRELKMIELKRELSMLRGKE